MEDEGVEENGRSWHVKKEKKQRGGRNAVIEGRRLAQASEDAATHVVGGACSFRVSVPPLMSDEGHWNAVMWALDPRGMAREGVCKQRGESRSSYTCRNTSIKKL
jgi:hypothetical protein